MSFLLRYFWLVLDRFVILTRSCTVTDASEFSGLSGAHPGRLQSRGDHLSLDERVPFALRKDLYFALRSHLVECHLFHFDSHQVTAFVDVVLDIRSGI